MGLFSIFRNTPELRKGKRVTLKAFGTTATIDTANGQLVSLKNRGVEFIYQQKGLWKNSFIHMFPICFALKDNKYLFDGKELSMKRHGFWRDFSWTIGEKTVNKLELNASNISTFSTIYPFKFEAKIIFALTEEGLSVNCHIKNIDEQRMFFNFGHHPAFELYRGNEEASIKFETKENIEAIHAQYREESPRLDSKEKIEIKTFDWETVNCFLIQNSSSQNIKLFNGRSTLNIKTLAPHLMLWKPTNKSEFVAIEPSYGLPDTQNQNPLPIEEKEGIQSLSPDQEFVDRLHFSFE